MTVGAHFSSRRSCKAPEPKADAEDGSATGDVRSPEPEEWGTLETQWVDDWLGD
jgi:hypothetical protein